MKILVIGKFYTEGFALHIAETLEAMGHQVARFEPGFKSGRIKGVLGHRLDQVRGVLRNTTDSIPVIRSRRMRQLWRVAEDQRPEVMIVCHDFLWPAEVGELKRRAGGQVALWFPDAALNFGRGYFMNAPYDGLFFKDPYIVTLLRKVVSSPVHYLPECFNPQQHRLPFNSLHMGDKYSCDITTAGSQHSWRVAVMKHLAGYDVKLWGNPAPLWLPTGPIAEMHQGRPVYNEEKVRAFRGAKIVLNNLHYSEVSGVNVRCFEAAGAGAFQMVDWRPGLSQLFDDGKELISFRDISDMKAKVDYWLPRGGERRAIAEAGMKRAHAEHTYQHRLELLLETLEGRAHGFPVPIISWKED